MAGAKVLAGHAGLGRMVRYVNIMEVPDVLPWTKADELLLTTGYPLRSTPDALEDFVAQLDQRGLAGIAIKLGRYIDALPAAMLESADRLGFPVLQVPDGVGFDEILNQILSDVLGRQAALLIRGEQAHSELLQVVLHGGGLLEVAQALPGQLAGDEAGVTVLHIDRTGRTTVTAGAPVPAQASVLFDPDGLLRTTAFGHGVHAVGPLSVLVAAVAAEGDHGWLVALRTELSWDGQDLIALERGATVAALVVTRELAVQAVERKYRGDFLQDVLAGRVTADAAVAGARGFDWDMTGPMVVVVAAAAELPPSKVRRTAGGPNSWPPPGHPGYAGGIRWPPPPRSLPRRSQCCTRRTARCPAPPGSPSWWVVSPHPVRRSTVWSGYRGWCRTPPAWPRPTPRRGKRSGWDAGCPGRARCPGSTTSACTDCCPWFRTRPSSARFSPTPWARWPTRRATSNPMSCAGR